MSYDIDYARILDLRSSGHLPDALDLAQSAQGAADAADDLYWRIKITLERSILELLCARPKVALTHLNPILALIHSPRRAELEEMGLIWEMTRAHILFVDCAMNTSSYSPSQLLKILDTGEQFLEEVGHSEWRDGLLSLRADIYADLDRDDEAVELLKEAMAVRERAGRGSPGFQVASYARNLARLLNELGRREESERVLREILDAPTTSTLDRMAAWIYLGRTLHDDDRDEEAAEAAEQGWKIALNLFEKQRVPVLGLMVDVYRALHRDERARWAADEILRIARKLGSREALVGALQDQADVAMDHGEVDAARGFLDEAREIGKSLDRVHETTKYTERIHERVRRLNQLANTT